LEKLKQIRKESLNSTSIPLHPPTRYNLLSALKVLVYHHQFLLN